MEKMTTPKNGKVQELGKSFPLMSSATHKTALAIKRPADIIISGIGLVLFSPIMLVIALAVRLDSPGSILFRQRRIGLNGKEFWLHSSRRRT